MDAREFLDSVESFDEITRRMVELATSEDEASVEELTQFLLVKDPHTYGKHSTPAIACRALLCHGEAGIKALMSILVEPEGMVLPLTALECLWYASHGQCAPVSFFFAEAYRSVPKELDVPPSPVAANLAQQAFRDFVAEAQEKERYFDLLVGLLARKRMSKDAGSLSADQLRTDVFVTITEASIKITKRLLGQYGDLLQAGCNEEEYQKFLSLHPVFLDPLASAVVPKQCFGSEFKSDFVVRRLDNEYFVVEIEKPQDSIFTKADDFSSSFSHAIGQVVDFMEWIDAHGEYARSLMPGVSAPRGLLVMGLRTEMSERQQAKLKRLNVNLKDIDVLTFDDLLNRSTTLYNNLHRIPTEIA